MAIKSTFIADFSSFSQAVQGAQITLKGFEADTNKVGSALTRMTDSFSGRKAVTEATLMGEAFKRLSNEGIKFTGDELKKMGAVADAAIAKFNVMGREVPRDIQAVSDASKTAADATQSWAAQMNSLMGLFGVGLGVGALVGFAKELLRTGDELVRVADRTGLTTIEVQKLEFIAGQSGNTIDQLTNAIGQLQKRLTTGDTAAVAAVHQLGLNLDALKAQSPYQQMETLAEALAKVSDPAQLATLQVQLFGKAGAEIIPTMISNFKALGDSAPVMSDKTVRALDTAGDALAKFGQQVKVFAAESYNFVGAGFDVIISGAYKAASSLLNFTAGFLEIEKHIPGVTTAFAKLGISTEGIRQQAQEFSDTGKLLISHLGDQEVAVRKTAISFTDFEPELQKVAKATKVATGAVKEHAAAIIGLGDGEKTLEGVLKLQQEQFQRYYERLEQIIPATRDWNSLLALTPGEIIEVTAALNDFNNVGTKTGVEVLPGLVQGDGIQKTVSALREMGDTMQGVAQILTTSQGAIGDIARAYLVAAKATEDYEKATTLAGKATAVAAGVAAVAAATGQGSTKSRVAGGAITGMQVGMIAGPWGAAIGAGVGALVGWIRGRGAEVKAATEEFGKYFTSSKDALEKTTAAYLKYGHTATEAQQDVQHALDATHKSAQAEAAALKIIQDKIAFGASAFDALTEAIGRYKFSTQELGSVLAKQKLDEQAKQLLSDWNLLSAAGINIAAIGREMGDSINQFQQDAVASSQEVDVALKPMLQKMKDMGLLTDAAGNKIEDFDAAGIHFSMTMSEGFKTVVDAVKEMTAAIKQALGIVDATAAAVDKLGDAANNIPDNPFANWDAPTAGRTPDMSSPSYAGGGSSNLVAFPGRKVPLVTPSQQRSVLSGGASGGPIEITLVTQLDGRVVAETVTRVQDNDQRLRRKMRAA